MTTGSSTASILYYIMQKFTFPIYIYTFVYHKYIPSNKHFITEIIKLRIFAQSYFDTSFDYLMAGCVSLIRSMIQGLNLDLHVAHR
jgi:hypothetical protein